MALPMAIGRDASRSNAANLNAPGFSPCDCKSAFLFFLPIMYRKISVSSAASSLTVTARMEKDTAFATSGKKFTATPTVKSIFATCSTTWERAVGTIFMRP